MKEFLIPVPPGTIPLIRFLPACKLRYTPHEARLPEDTHM
jgi:hypothetical protein